MLTSGFWYYTSYLSSPYLAGLHIWLTLSLPFPSAVVWKIPTNKQEIGLYPKNCLKWPLNSQRKRNLYESGQNLFLKILFSYNKPKFHVRIVGLKLMFFFGGKKVKTEEWWLWWSGDGSPVQYWSESSSCWSGLPAQKSFTEDLDLGVNRQ